MYNTLAATTVTQQEQNTQIPGKLIIIAIILATAVGTFAKEQFIPQPYNAAEIAALIGP